MGTWADKLEFCFRESEPSINIIMTYIIYVTIMLIERMNHSSLFEYQDSITQQLGCTLSLIIVFF